MLFLPFASHITQKWVGVNLLFRCAPCIVDITPWRCTLMDCATTGSARTLNMATKRSLKVWHDQRNWARQILQYRMLCLIECLDQVGMLFLSDLSRQKCTKYTGQQGFDVPDSPTGHGEEKKDFRRQQTQMETGHQMCRKRDRTAFRVRGSDKIYRTADSVRGVSHFTECAENQKTRLVVGTNKDLALLRVRGESQHNTIREVTLDEDRHEYRTADQHTTMRDVTPDGEI